MERNELPQYERVGKRGAEGAARAERGSARAAEYAEEQAEKNAPPEKHGEVIDMERAREELRGAYAREKPAKQVAEIRQEHSALEKEIAEIEQTIHEYNTGPLWQKAWHYIFDSRQLKDEWNSKVHRLRVLEKQMGE